MDDSNVMARVRSDDEPQSFWRSFFTHTNDPSLLSYYERITEGGQFALYDSETWWRDRYELLESRGYRLRPRFKPGWIPSWTGNNRVPFFRDDSCDHMVSWKVVFRTRL